MLEKLLSITLVVFMVGNLLDMGLRLDVRQAWSAMRNARFTAQTVLWGFILCPALAYAITMVVPLAPPYATGMILLGMAPCAPFLPMMAEKARGDLSYAAAFMVLASVITVAYMPLAVPVLVKGFAADAWTIAKPLVSFIVVPLVIGVATQRVSAPFSARFEPVVKKTTGINTMVMLALCVIIYRDDFIGAVGTYAFGAQILFFSVATAGSYGLAIGLPRNQRSVLALGMATRNLGAAFAPLLAAAGVDRRAIVMVAIGVPMQTIAAVVAARWFGRAAPDAAPAAARPAEESVPVKGMSR